MSNSELDFQGVGMRILEFANPQEILCCFSFGPLVCSSKRCIPWKIPRGAYSSKICLVLFISYVLGALDIYNPHIFLRESLGMLLLMPYNSWGDGVIWRFSIQICAGIQRWWTVLLSRFPSVVCCCYVNMSWHIKGLRTICTSSRFLCAWRYAMVTLSSGVVLEQTGFLGHNIQVFAIGNVRIEVTTWTCITVFLLGQTFGLVK